MELLRGLHLLGGCCIIAFLPLLESHNHHRGYSKRDNATHRDIHSNSLDVQLADAIPVFPEEVEDNALSQDAVNAEILMLLKALTTEMDALRLQVSNLKLQNHLVYKTMRRMQAKCQPQELVPVIASAAQKQAPPPPPTKPTCPDDYVWNKELQSCYKFATDRITWRMAREKCRVQGGDLVSILSDKEQRYIMEKARKSPDTRHCDFWAGLTDRETEGDWRWTQGNKQLLYSNWNLDEPNNGSGNEHCMHLLWVFNWAWNDAHCNRDNSCYICQIRF